VRLRKPTPGTQALRRIRFLRRPLLVWSFVHSWGEGTEYPCNVIHHQQYPVSRSTAPWLPLGRRLHVLTPSRRSLAASYISLAAVSCLLVLTVVPTIQCGSCRGRTLSAQDNVQGVSGSRLPRFVRSHMTSTEHLRHHQNPCRCCISSRCQITTDCRVHAVCFRAISAALWSRYTSRLVEY
jgi:hypothetical protein